MNRTRKVTTMFIAYMILLSMFAGCSKQDSDIITDSNKSVSTGKKDESDKTKAANSRPVVDVVAGGTAQFGSYEQDNNTANGKEPIVWRVLAVEDGRALLLADKILDCKPYNIEHKNVTWETCTLRVWLNNEFYNDAFNTGEKAKIRITRVINKDNPDYKTDGGNDTDDSVFLLSYIEATNSAYGFNSKNDLQDTARRAQGTDFAKSNGIWVSTDNSSFGNSNWWLRTPGITPFDACSVYSDGFISTAGHSVINTYIGVRPALWINL